VTHPALQQLSATTWAWTWGRTAWGYSNCGLVADQGQALLIDTQFTLADTQALLDAISDAVPGARITTVINTHANGDHTWGNQLVSGAEIITSEACHDHMADEIGPQELTALCQAPATTGAAAYAAEHFAPFDFSGIRLTGPTRTFTGRLEIEVGGVEVELLDLGAAHSGGDVAVHVPADGVVFAGDILFQGGHMVVWSDSLIACVRACDRLLDTGATTFVPGHGAIVDRAGVIAIRDVLDRVSQAATAHAQAGTPLADAARLIKAEFAGTWAHPERLFSATAAGYRDAGVADVPSSPLELVEGMANLVDA
jgi:cyclase